MIPAHALQNHKERNFRAAALSTRLIWYGSGLRRERPLPPEQLKESAAGHSPQPKEGDNTAKRVEKSEEHALLQLASSPAAAANFDPPADARNPGKRAADGNQSDKPGSDRLRRQFSAESELKRAREGRR